MVSPCIRFRSTQSYHSQVRTHLIVRISRKNNNKKNSTTKAFTTKRKLPKAITVVVVVIFFGFLFTLLCLFRLVQACTIAFHLHFIKLKFTIFVFFTLTFLCSFGFSAGERYDFVITADQPVGAYWIQLRGLGECGIRRVQQLAVLRYARGPYQPTAPAPTYDVGIPQGVVSIPHTNYTLIFLLFLHTSSQWSDHINACRPLSTDKKRTSERHKLKWTKKKKRKDI